MKKKLMSFFMVLILILSSLNAFASEETSESVDTTVEDNYESIDTSTYYYDRFDNSAYRNVYSQIKESAEVFHTSTTNAEYHGSDENYYYTAFSITVTSKDWDVIGYNGMQMVINAFLADNPTYFWMSSDFKYTTKSLDSGSVCYVVDILCYNDYANGTTRQVLVNNINITVANYAALFSDDSPNYQKEYIIHNAIIEDTYFDVEDETNRTGDAWAYTADGVFNSKHKTATSFGYAKAFKAVMDYVGIKCIYVEGNTTEVADSDTNETYHAHAWNMICLDDGWYVVDLAYDDPETTSGKDVLVYDYFNITSEKATGLVPATDWLSGIPTCNGSTYSIDKVQSLLENNDIWQDDNYYFYDRILDTYGVSVVLISLGVILILLVALIKRISKNRKKKRQEKIKNTKTVTIDHSDLDKELRNPPL